MRAFPMLLLKRLRGAADWLGGIAGGLLENACAKPPRRQGVAATPKGLGKSLLRARLIVNRRMTWPRKRWHAGGTSDAEATTGGSHAVTAAGFVMLLTSIPVDEMTTQDDLQTYRLRWQVELPLSGARAEWTSISCPHANSGSPESALWPI
ncbi:hypothetical protein AJ88_37425 [Mesorhizobium amorphae CCBAU 01583]|nr:hypothetical protein AJ88_37425 [Mesorhizobium amorphae CCBAU 01583]